MDARGVKRPGSDGRLVPEATVDVGEWIYSGGVELLGVATRLRGGSGNIESCWYERLVLSATNNLRLSAEPTAIFANRTREPAMTKPKHHLAVTDEDLIKLKDAAQIVNELDEVLPGEMTELFYAAHYWDLMESLRDVLEMLDFGNAPEHPAVAEHP